MSDETDDNTPKDPIDPNDSKESKEKPKKTLLQKQVVVTYGEKKEVTGDIPSEILPQTPSHVVSNPIESSVPPVIRHTTSTVVPKSQIHPKIPEAISPQKVIPPIYT